MLCVWIKFYIFKKAVFVLNDAVKTWLLILQLFSQILLRKQWTTAYMSDISVTCTNALDPSLSASDSLHVCIASALWACAFHPLSGTLRLLGLITWKRALSQNLASVYAASVTLNVIATDCVGREVCMTPHRPQLSEDAPACWNVTRACTPMTCSLYIY